ncbi:MAG TPA: YciI family protein [Nitrospiraceae bacterium]|nr:YciI family protein [Nitrospiraceae bacterium]
MKYLLLVHHNEEAFGKIPEATRQGMLAESIQLCHQLDDKGQYVHASPLHPTATGARVQVREGKRFTTDGPFAETHEQIAGYFLITAKDRDEAIDIAGRIPGARIGTVEVRQVREVAGLPGEGP